MIEAQNNNNNNKDDKTKHSGELLRFDTCKSPRIGLRVIGF